MVPRFIFGGRVNKPRSPFRFGGGGVFSGWTPADVTPFAWYDATDSDTITESGGSVSQWDDKSGNARHLSEASASRQPTWNTTDEVDFDGSEYIWHDSAFMYANGECDAYMIVRATPTTTGVILSESSLTSPADYNNVESFNSTEMETYIRNDAGGTVINHDTLYNMTGLWDDTTRLVLSRDTGSEVSGYVGGTLGNTHAYTRTGVLTLVRFAFGCSLKGTPVQYSNCGIKEAVFTDNLSTNDRQKMEGYLAWKHGLETDLPSGHPYEDEAP